MTLISAKNLKHQSHQCTKFARATISALEELAGLLGPGDVTFQDDKAKMPIGLTATSKQVPLLMHMEYKVTLPQHKLIPSVIGDMRVREKDFSGDAVTYSGLKYCVIQRAKYSGSSVYHHLKDMKRIQYLDIFNHSFNNDTGESKPVIIVTVDGSPDENPRYIKTIVCAID